jgi:CPA2 family monovalent cation:H+ antiporter-2
LIPLKEAQGSGFVELPVSLVKILVIFFVFYLLDKYLIPKVTSFLDRISEEDTFVFFLLGSILITGLLFKELGISEALGAFLLGVLVPETRIMENIEHHLSALKEFSIGVFFFFFAYETHLQLPEELSLLVLITVLGIGSKIISTYIAGWVFGLKRKSRLRAALSFVPRGEFSVIIASMEPSVKVISVPFIFITAVLGSFLFGFSGKVADWVYPPKRRKVSKERIQAPAS